MPRRLRKDDDLLEYHEAPPQLVRDMEEWLAVGDRRDAAARVRAWLLDAYALAPVKVKAKAKTKARAERPRRRARVSRGSSSR